MVHVTLILDSEAKGDGAELRTKSSIQNVMIQALNHVPGWQDTPQGLCLNVRITDPDTMRQYNKTHRHQDKSTNVLSFPVLGPDQPFFQMPGGQIFLGDLLLCWKDIVDQAHDQGKTVDQHAIHLLVHGLLHLLHYDHETDVQAQVMEALETRILGAMGWPRPY